MPGRQIVVIRQAVEEISHVWIGFRVGNKNRVVDVPGFLPPRVEDYFFPGVVGMQRGDHALDRIIEEHRADADAHVELEAMSVGEKWLVLADWLTLVIEDRPAAARPSRADVVRRRLRLAVRADDDLPLSVTRRNGARFGLNLFLNFPPEAVGI